MDLSPLSPFRRYLLPVLIVAGAALLATRGGHWTAAQRSWDAGGPAAAALFVTSGVVMMSCFVPKTAVSVTAGMLFGTWLGSWLLTATAVLAAALNYVIGRSWLRGPLEARCERRPGQLLQATRDVAADAGVGFHLLLRLAPLPTTVISYSMGAAGARPAPFLVAALLGTVPQWVWVHSGATTAQAATENTPGGWIGVAVSIAGAVTLSLLLPRAALKRLREAKAAGEGSAVLPASAGPAPSWPPATSLTEDTTS